MKKRQMITVLVMAAALMGCAHKENFDVQNAAENSAASQAAMDDAAAGNDDGQNSGQAGEDDSGVKNTGGKESDDSVINKNDNSVRNADEAGSNSGSRADDNDSDVKNTAGDAAAVNGEKITAFGDKSTMNNRVGERELPIYCVDTEENKIALSFDAAWGAEDTEEILSILKEHDIYVTFFATGGWVESYPDDVKAVLAAGHDLGNHSENHKNMSSLSNADKEEELMAVHRKVKELTGYDMFLFRPPYGDYDNAVINTAKDCGYYAIQWDVDSLDWKNYGVDSIIETVTGHKNLGNGSIILCHNGAEYTVDALDELITGLEGQGYEIVPVSELIYRDGFHLNYEGRQIKD